MSYIFTTGIMSTSSPYSPLSPAVITSEDYLVTSEFVSPNLLFTKGPINISINPNYSTPLVGFYDNLNEDPNVRSRMVKYIYYKVLDSWLYNDLIDLLSYLKVRDGKVSLIDSVDDYKASNVDKDSDEVIEKKIEYIEKFFLHRRFLYTYHDNVNTLLKLTFNLILICKQSLNIFKRL